MEMTPEALKKILDDHAKWLRDEEGGVRANLTRANLTRANLTRANLDGANLTRANLDGANLYGANLYWANLYGANLTRANLTRANLTRANLTRANLYWANLDGANLTRANLYGANLTRANLDGASLDGANGESADFTMPDGLKFSEYKATVVPALLTAGGKSLREVLATGCWRCRDWSNCPMHAAFGIASADEAPRLLRARVAEFVQLFDAGLIPEPEIPAGEPAAVGA